MASLIFGLYKNKAPKEQKHNTNYDPMKDLPRGSSGEQADDTDDTSNESDSNMTQSYFDPPVANYKFNYYTLQRDNNVMQPGTGGKSEFKIIRRIRRGSQASRNNSFITQNSGMNRPSESSAIGLN